MNTTQHALGVGIGDWGFEAEKETENQFNNGKSIQWNGNGTQLAAIARLGGTTPPKASFALPHSNENESHTTTNDKRSSRKAVKFASQARQKLKTHKHPEIVM